MSNLNKAQVIGNLTRTPELKTLPGGQKVCQLGLATNRKYKTKDNVLHDEVEFHNLVAWGQLAETCAKFLHKGSKVFFEGRLKTSTWEDKDGGKRFRTEIIISDMEFLDAKSDKKAEPIPIEENSQQETKKAEPIPVEESVQQETKKESVTV